ncbi:MAG: DUF6512 family protein [Dehalococcoidales bacterium]|nr:DUF6512 family protein [Dehalococcoidales bacterium]
MKSLFRWELAGLIFIVVVGAALHFVFDLAGGWRPLAVIAAVNESVWEHLKLAFWPALAFSIAEFFFVRKISPNFFAARATGILLMPVSIIVLFYGYTAFMEDALAIDILIFVLAVAIGQSASYRILTMRPLPAWLNTGGIALLVIMTGAFGTMSFYPPSWEVFRDPLSGGYGIP